MKAFTLMELIIAVAVMVLLMALALRFLPSVESRLASQGADQLQTLIAAARARAARDHCTTGLRFIPSADGNYRQVQVIQQPEPFVVQSATFYNQVPAGSQGVCLMVVPGDITMSVSTGDLLSVADGVGCIQIPAPAGVKHLDGPVSEVNRVVSISYSGGYTSLHLVSAPSVCPIWNPQSVSVAVTGGVRFIREPRPLMGEVPTQLPRYVRVDALRSRNLDTSYLPSYQGSLDMCFSPSGQVNMATTGRVVLWVDDDHGVSQPTLLCVYTRTGTVAAHPAAPGPNPYLYTQDGLNSGQ